MVAVAQDIGVPVAYLPGLSMRRISDLTPGNAKTDARHAQVIAQAERTMPHTLRAITTSDEDATFDTGAQLASYAGLAPLTRRSGSSIRGKHVSHAGNKHLKRAMFPSAFASIRTDQVSRAYYERKRAQGKRHNQALLALAHRRILTLHATLTDDAPYDPQPAPELAVAA